MDNFDRALDEALKGRSVAVVFNYLGSFIEFKNKLEASTGDYYSDVVKTTKHYIIYSVVKLNGKPLIDDYKTVPSVGYILLTMSSKIKLDNFDSVFYADVVHKDLDTNATPVQLLKSVSDKTIFWSLDRLHYVVSPKSAILYHEEIHGKTFISLVKCLYNSVILSQSGLIVAKDHHSLKRLKAEFLSIVKESFIKSIDKYKITLFTLSGDIVTITFVTTSTPQSFYLGLSIDYTYLDNTELLYTYHPTRRVFATK